jgi:hypothetical protein
VDDHLDLDGHIERQLGHPDCGLRVAAGVTTSANIGGPVHDLAPTSLPTGGVTDRRVMPSSVNRSLITAAAEDVLPLTNHGEGADDAPVSVSCVAL